MNLQYYCPSCRKTYTEQEFLIHGLLAICECGEDLLQMQRRIIKDEVSDR